MAIDRRRFLISATAAASATALPPSIARALDIPARSRTGTVMDVEHVVILTQENRSFDHYFGSLRGVRGFGDRFAIPARDATVFAQPSEHDPKKAIAPFRLDTGAHAGLIRVSGTPHGFADAQAAWDNGRMSAWPAAKHDRAMGYYTRADIPFQFALAEAFTICDAYHCSIHAGTNPNRTFLWTGTNDGLAQHHGPVIDNGYDHLEADPLGHGGYAWVTYPERLTAAGISWQIYQNAKDNFTDNPLEGFKLYRFADKTADGPLARLAERALRTRDLDRLKADVLAGTLPQVSWIVATAEGSEHPTPSSPAQGADYTARVLDALTANPEVWAKTVLLINFDENDGFFDHVPPPAPPSKFGDALLGHSDIDTAGEYHLGEDERKGQPYGLGPRVPMYVVSPWSKGGFVNSQVFDHTSVIRFLEARFGVHEPNISPWRRAVCGDLLSCFDFANPQTPTISLPDTEAAAAKAHSILLTATPDTPDSLAAPVQETGSRPARPLPYHLAADVSYAGAVPTISLQNSGRDVAAVFHIYSPKSLDLPPARFTLAPGGSVAFGDADPKGADLFVLGPNGFHRRFVNTTDCSLKASLDGTTLRLETTRPVAVTWRDEAYGQAERRFDLIPGTPQVVKLDFGPSHNWYDFSLSGDGFRQRFAGHIEDGRPSLSDPAMGGSAPLKL
ncbi:MAG TPA: phospholipase C, phosphocholine-specific [Asticcacaulis sp.]|nr:phospholipase C, phosphocholine-specific [Asticcacaulis sp.]